MRICLISGTYPPKVCGIASYTQRLSEQLVRYGADVSVITSAVPQITTTAANLQLKAVMPAWTSMQLRRLVREIAACRADILHVQYQIATFGNGGLVSWLPLVDALGQGRGMVTTFHDYSGPPWLGPAHVLPVLWLLLASKYLIVTHEKPRKAFERVPFLRKKLAKVPVGSNIPVVASRGSEKLCRTGDESLICYFGFVWRGKNVEQLITVVRGLLDKGLSTRLQVIGEIVERDYYEDLRRLAQQLGVADRISFTDKVSDDTVSRLLQQSDLCILPFTNGASTGHGTLIAALEHGVPTVTTAGPGVALVDGVEVLLVPPGDQAALEQAAERLLRSPELRATLSRNARACAQKTGWYAIALTHIELYTQILTGVSRSVVSRH